MINLNPVYGKAVVTYHALKCRLKEKLGEDFSSDVDNIMLAAGARLLSNKNGTNFFKEFRTLKQAEIDIKRLEQHLVSMETSNPSLTNVQDLHEFGLYKSGVDFQTNQPRMLPQQRAGEINHYLGFRVMSEATLKGIHDVQERYRYLSDINILPSPRRV